MSKTTKQRFEALASPLRGEEDRPTMPVHKLADFRSDVPTGVSSGVRSGIVIESAPLEMRAKALWTVFSKSQRSERLDQAAALLAAAARRVISLEHLLIARRGDQLVGATLAIAGPGRSAHVWPSRLVGDEPPQTASELVAEQERRLAASDVVFAQTFAGLEDAEEIAAFRSQRYQAIGDLVWMSCRACDFPTGSSEGRLEFQAFNGDFARMTQIVERTYEGTLDCPTMNELRSTRDVMEGYRSSPGFRSDRWWTVARQGEPVGCLLLADHAQQDQTELVYCGIAPEARGQRFGQELTRFAQETAKRDGRARLILSVDAANRPALAIYAQAGFRAHERRRVLAKKLSAHESFEHESEAAALAHSHRLRRAAAMRQAS